MECVRVLKEEKKNFPLRRVEVKGRNTRTSEVGGKNPSKNEMLPALIRTSSS